jgi:tRNA pseudouridine38-40 synthase
MAHTLLQVLGEHDFAAFALSGHAGHGRRGTVRTVTAARLRGRGRRLDIVLEGDGFLRGMVRRIVGALIEVGRGTQPPTWFAALVREPITRPPAPTAPAHGLTLERVFY